MESVGRSLRNMWIIAKQEFSLFFSSPLVYFLGAGWLFFAGLFFIPWLGLFNQGYELSVNGMLQTLAFLAIFMAPALTMRMVSEEIRTGTHELLFTSPVRDWEIITGKWLGAWGVMIAFTLLTLVYPLYLFTLGSPDPGQIISAYIGFLLLWGMVLALGMLTSSLTQYQLVSFIIGFVTLIVLWVAGSFVNAVYTLIPSQILQTVMQEVTIQAHLHDTMLGRGIIRPVDIAYFVGLIAIFLFLATQVLGSRRWRA
jgi:ABC-2 type transport system permease protein